MKPLHVPLADVLKLARTLQYQQTDYGSGITAKQIEQAERIIRRLIREHLAGKWSKR
jgi:type III secretory pathway component EscU